jgi:hypothetical protein
VAYVAATDSAWCRFGVRRREAARGKERWSGVVGKDGEGRRHDTRGRGLDLHVGHQTEINAPSDSCVSV